MRGRRRLRTGHGVGCVGDQGGAVERGELPAGTDPMLLVDLLTGAWLRVVFRAEHPPADFVERTVDTILQGALSRHPT